ncbi:MAG TPA: LON peptidase substrate-binding domain-containing protein, partial [Micromonosporaceae bacterium]
RLPLFSLGTVLFPGLVLPLHVFEERYRALVRHLTRLPEAEREFGVVAIRRGWEVQTAPAAVPGSPPVPVVAHEIGCSALIRRMTELPEGRFDLVVVGGRRFRVVDVDETSPYPTAAVEWLSETPGADAHRLAPQVLERFQEYLALIRPATVAETLPDEPTLLSYAVASAMALSVEDRQSLLAAPDTADRLRAELRLLTRELVLLPRLRAVPAALAEFAVPASPN